MENKPDKAVTTKRTTGVKKRHRLALLKYMSDWENLFPNRTEVCAICGITRQTLHFHFTMNELAEIENEGLELRKKNSAVPRSRIYAKMKEQAEQGSAISQKEFLDRTEGKVVEKNKVELSGGIDVHYYLPKQDENK